MSEMVVQVQMRRADGEVLQRTGDGRDRFESLMEALEKLTRGRIETGDVYQVTFTGRGR